MEIRRIATWRARGAIFAFFVILLLPCTAVHAAELIRNFDVAAFVKKEGIASVEETIVYDFGNAEKHGIYRDISLISKNGPTLGVVVKSVTDENGAPYEFTNSVQGNDLHIRIGDPNRTITGQKTYKIAYNVYGAIRTFQDHDEFYWNVTGNEWNVSIQSAGFSVWLPEETGLSSGASLKEGTSTVTVDCYTGRAGENGRDCAVLPVVTSAIIRNGEVASSARGAAAVFVTTGAVSNRSFAAGEGLTVAIGFPKNAIAQLPIPQEALTINSAGANSSGGSTGDVPTWIPILISGIFFALILLVFGLRIFGVIKKIVGGGARLPPSRIRVPKELKGKPIVVQYEAPDGLLPVDAGTLADGSVDSVDFVSVIIDLAVKGYLKIRYIKVERAFFPDGVDYEFIKLKDDSDLAHPAYEIVHHLLFGDGDTITMSALKEYPAIALKSMEKADEKTYDYLAATGYYKTDVSVKEQMKNFSKIFSPFIGVGAVLAYFIFSGFVLALLAIPVIIAFVVRAGLYSSQNSGPTPAGVAAIGKLLGFKKFLEATEEDKMRLIDAPQAKPELFQKNLPYAMVFGVEKEWAKQFDGMMMTSPEWFEGYGGTMGSLILIDSLSHMGSAMGAAITPQGSGGGFSSGGGGGGFSGGGSGGGGGGSW